MKYSNYKVYKKALDRLLEDTHLTYRERRDDASLLYDLVNREKGIRPVDIFDYDNSIFCGDCNTVVFRHYNYCPTCGRKIDWSDWEKIRKEDTDDE